MDNVSVVLRDPAAGIECVIRTTADDLRKNYVMDLPTGTFRCANAAATASLIHLLRK